MNSGGGRVETVNWKVTKSLVSSSVDRAITVKVEDSPSVAFSKTESRTRKSTVELLPTVTVGESKKCCTNPKTDVSMFSVKLASPPLLKIVIVTDALSPGCNTKNPVSLSPGMYTKTFLHKLVLPDEQMHLWSSHSTYLYIHVRTVAVCSTCISNQSFLGATYDYN